MGERGKKKLFDDLDMVNSTYEQLRCQWDLGFRDSSRGFHWFGAKIWLGPKFRELETSRTKKIDKFLVLRVRVGDLDVVIESKFLFNRSTSPTK